MLVEDRREADQYFAGSTCIAFTDLYDCFTQEAPELTMLLYKSVDLISEIGLGSPPLREVVLFLERQVEFKSPSESIDAIDGVYRQALFGGSQSSR